ncbi:MAG: hypothetical protein QOG53_1101 [Frankiales bacterium]|nr:hypothetical protein [Frankiales bacterium]
MFFDSFLVFNHQSFAPTTLRSTERFRVCTASRCDAWTNLRTDGTPVTIRLDARHLKVTTGPTIRWLQVFWTGAASTIHIDWAYTQVQDGLDEATTLASISTH